MTDDTATTESHPLPARTKDMRPGIACAFVLLVTFFVYFRVMGYDFVLWDDDTHIHTNMLLNPVNAAHLVQFWRHTFHGLYIPVAYTIFSGLAVIAHHENPLPYTAAHVNLDPHVFHTANLVVHLANVALVFYLLHRLTKSTLGSASGALLYSVHPLQVESVAWVSEMRGLSCSFFSLLCVHAAFSWMDIARSDADVKAARRRYVLVLILFCTALLCKPAAATLPLVLLVIARYFGRMDWRKALLSVAPMVAIAAVMTLVTHDAQPMKASAISAVWQRPFIAGDALAFYLAKLFVPVRLCMDYGRTPQIVMAHWWGYVTWLLSFAVIMLVWRVRKKYPIIAAGSLLFLVVVLPVLGLVPFVYQGYSTVADRYTAFALIGPALVLAWFVSKTTQRIAIPLVACVLAMFCLLSAQQVQTWRDSTALFTRAVAINPNSAFDHNNLAAAYIERHEYARAIPELSEAIKLNPSFAEPHLGLADCLALLGRNQEAYTYFTQAITLDPKFVAALDDFGQFLMRNGKADQGLALYARAANVDTHDAVNWNNYGTALGEAGKVAPAISAFESAIAADPAFLPPHQNLAILYAQLNEPQLSMQQCTQIIALDPHNEVAYSNRGAAYLQLGQSSLAAADFTKALSMDPTDDSAKAGLAQATHMGG